VIEPEAAADDVNIFISHARQDYTWVQRLQVLLRPLARSQHLQVFSASDDIPVGVRWDDVIEESIRRADIAIMLISPSYLASDYIRSNELRVLLDRQRGGRIALLPVALEGSFWIQVPELANLQFALDPSRPLDSMTAGERDRALVDVATGIVELAGEIRQRRRKETQEPGAAGLESMGDAETGGRIFISHSHEDGDFAELLKLKLKAEGLDAWVDLDRLAPGVNWQTEIDSAIRSSRFLIAVLSPDARKSEYVTYEWAYALGVDRPVIPVMIRQTQLHPRLGAIQYLDFTLRGGRPWDRLITTLKATAQ